MASTITLCGPRMRQWKLMAIVETRFRCRHLRGFHNRWASLLITLPFNDFEGFERVMRSYGDQIAAVITEPCQGNCGAIEPQAGFLELIRKKTEEYGTIFILDEVKTGFRIANGGAQEYYRIKPDLDDICQSFG